MLDEAADAGRGANAGRGCQCSLSNHITAVLVIDWTNRIILKTFYCIIILVRDFNLGPAAASAKTKYQGFEGPIALKKVGGPLGWH